MHRKFDVRRYLTAFFVGIFAIVGSIVGIDAPANAVAGDSSTVDYTGTFNYTTGPSSASVSPIASNDTTFTVEAWVNPAAWTSTHDYMVIFGQGLTGAGCISNRYGLFLSNTENNGWKLHFAHNDCGVFSPVLVPNNSWTHIAQVVNGSSVTIFINGAQAWTTTYNWSASFSSGSVIGSAVDGADSFKGSIDQVKVWDSNLSQSQIQTSMNAFGAGGISGLNAHFDFNEGSGNIIYNRVNTGQSLSATSISRDDVKATSKVAGKTVVTFPRSYLTPGGGWTPPSGINRAEVLIVGGGGGGGKSASPTQITGGSGAGGAVYQISSLQLPTTAIPIGVGAGGLGSSENTGIGSSGGYSLLGSLKVAGGGGGYSYNSSGTGATTPGGADFVAGGNGGGAKPGVSSLGGPAGTAQNQTFNGATFTALSGVAGSGGSDAQSGGWGGQSSVRTSSISGTSVEYGKRGQYLAWTAGNKTPGSGGSTDYRYATGTTTLIGEIGANGIVVIAYAPIDDNFMNFNGTSQYAVASGAQVIPSTGAFTLEAWINPTSSGAPSTAIIASQGTGSTRFYVKRANNQLVTYRDQAVNSSEVVCGTLPVDQWVHIAIAYDNSKAYCFINGSLVASPNFVYGSETVSTGFYVGQYSAAPSDPNSWWKGAIDQVKVWNTAITDSALIARSMNAYADQDTTGYISGSSGTPVLTNLYPFNEATGTATVADMVGSANLTTTGSPTSTSIVSSSTPSGATVYSFPRTFLNAFGGWFPPVNSSTASALVVAGGGGGGGWAWGGGGGAGAMLTASANQTLSVNTPKTVIVGVGGAGGLQVDGDTNKGANGGDTTFGSATAKGGGAGAGWGYMSQTSSRSTGSSGGSGGGHSEYQSTLAAAASNQPDVSGFTKRGNAGGAMERTASQGGSGGGGAGSAGISIVSSAAQGTAGAGGAGFQSSITGVATYYAAGGAGGQSATDTASLGGSSIGGNGGSSTLAPTAGVANTGSGGGGAGMSSKGGSGGSGVVIVSLPSSVQTPTISSQPADLTKSAGETATFSVTAAVTDGGTLSYQWEVSANNGSTWMNVADGTGGTTNSYTTASLVSADLGKQYRVKVTNTLSGLTAVTSSTAATLTIGLDKINVNFDELNFDFSNVLHVVGTNGKAQGNKVLFLNVTTKGGVQVDALVTTETLSGATITNYETGARAGGANSYFQTDVDFTAANGFAQFKFDFYKHGVAGAGGNPCTVANPNCTGATKVVIQNVNVSAIDIDYYQWNDFTLAESYTLAGNTKLKECVIPNTGTCTTRSAPASFPADMRFQGSPDTARTNDPVDMAIVTYADIETFRIKFGRDRAGSPNYYGVAFKALDWGVTTPQTTGGTNYTISYNSNSPTSGSQSGTHVGAAGSTFTVLSAGTAVKTGYTFAGWATSSTATTADYTASSKVTMPGSNLTLYAVWTPIKYTLTYNVNGGSGAPAAGSYETGTNNVTLSSTVPTRTGYVFGGWDTVVNSGAGNVNYASGATYSMPASNTTLYAKWTIANGTLAYNGNNGTTTQASVTAAGNTTTTVANGSNTSRTGYDFVGWNSKADGTGTSYAVGSTFTLQATVTTTIYAQWTLSKYTLVFNVNGGTGTPQSQSYVQGATTTMPVTNPTRAGYTFAGWNSAADGTGTNYTGSFLMPGNNLTLYAKWTPITYIVTYNNNSATYSGATGTVSDATNYTAAQTVTVAAGTGLSNTTGSITYVFTGWNTNADGTGTDYMPGSTFAMPAGNRTLYAMWVDASIEIAYNANGGTGAPANTNATTGQSFTISATQPNRSGYTFGGWSLQDNSPSGGPYSASGTFTPNSNEVLVAQWTAVNYTVTYNSDGGSTAPAQLTNKHIDDTISVDGSAPTKTGYTFLGWKDGAGNIYPAGGTFKMPAGDVTLTAQWQGNAYTLTYDANGGASAPAAETRNYTATANLSSTAPTRTGYTFQGWNTLVGGNGTAYNAPNSLSFTMPNSNTTLFAQWTVNNFLLTYNTQGGSTAPSGGSTNYNVEVTVSGSTPTKTGYSFAGWNTLADGSGTTYLQSAKFNMPNADVTLYAQWTKTAYTLYYNTNGGQGVFSSQPVKYSESVTVDSTTPTKTGYTFSGWNTAANGSGSDFNPMGVFTLNVESNVTLYAKWTAISYSLAYNANSGSGAPTGGSHNFGASVTTANKGSMNLSGYRFVGWNTRADGSGATYIEGAAFSMPAENVILYAQWIDSRFEIAYNANGGSGGPEGADIDDGTLYTVDSIQPVRPGYTFDGWKLADGTPSTSTYKAGTGTQSFTISGNEVLVAQWTVKTITVTYDLNGGGGTTPTADSGNYNTNITLASSSGVNRNNYQFVGWSTTPDGSGPTYVDGSTFKLPADDVILYAKWAPIYYVIEYNPAGGSGEPADQFATPSSTVAIATQEPTKTGYEFDKWTEVSQGTEFTPGSSLTMPSSNVVLVASYTVRAASVPGSGSNTGVVDPGGKPIIAKPKQLVLSVYFAGDSSVLTPRAKTALKKLAAKAKAYGRANNITIYGRVKETNDKSYDLRLSKARAANVAAFLKKYGVTGVYRVSAKGISPENTFRSRRVDMTLWWAK
ncbi:InlB B-repeat-containing protein [Rhodoluna lacicola]|uniref:Outer membrane protein-related peptidoglycan-associated (Lipo)protein n=1 Tax=Rhodoluna lacicola TaxID=529884 RepID=A0A060JE87_9MICO|nr:InlB B-repeat-containing protein [Rhodoluna lacicola]AIC47075.1 Outer membrane protein-related peptidoglycan-associated (lipo)protein [Rhodoluna lacicola]